MSDLFDKLLISWNEQDVQTYRSFFRDDWQMTYHSTGKIITRADDSPEEEMREFMKNFKRDNSRCVYENDDILITNDTILATERLIKTGFFSNKYHLIKVPKGEELGANCLSINYYVLIPKGFHGISELLTKEYKIKEVDVSEMEKVDAGLSCMSIRW